MKEELSYQASCAIPINNHTRILQAHGGGGTLSDNLISSLFIKTFDNEYLHKKHDGAVLPVSPDIKLAFSTDSFVIDPIFFPGGNIGELAVYGTVNDVACCGAKPQFLSLSFIIEEGFPINDLITITASVKKAADEAGVAVVTGDTKVVGKGKGDKIYINTTGIGICFNHVNIDPARAVPGDAVICSAPVAAHGISIMSVRAGLGFETDIISDCRPLNKIVEDVLHKVPDVHVIRDATRGGIASVLNEIATSASVNMTIEETEIPLDDKVSSACELLGFDPLYVANEGVLIMIAPASVADKILQVMHRHEGSKHARIIGWIPERSAAPHVMLETILGSRRILSMLSGEQLPRIC